MKYCRNCGKELNSDIQYCPNCGASVSEEQSGKNENSYQESNADGSLWESLVEFFKALIEYMKEAGLHIIDAIDKIIQMPPNIPKDSICPYCNSEDTFPIVKNETEIKTKGYSMGRGCCGMCLLGPFGLLCGALFTGSKVKSRSITWWGCKNCGRQHLAQHDAVFLSRKRYHSDWCSMIYARLLAARNLLCDDGVIFISIDDNEQANLKKICDEVFGERNFVNCFIWNCSTAGGIRPKFASKTHEYILCYAKNKTCLDMFFAPLSGEAIKMYREKDERGLYRDKDFVFKNKSTNANQKYEIICPDGERVRPKDGYIYRFVRERFEQAKEEGLVTFKRTKTGPLVDQNGDQAHWNIYIKKYLGDAMGAPSTLIPKEAVSIYNAGTQCVQELFDGKRVFENVKPVNVIQYFINMAAKDGDIVMDFFSGSATTAHAVMQTEADKNIDLHYILVQIPQECDKKSEAYKAGYKTICEIGKERIRRAAEKIKRENGCENRDFGFRVLRLDESNMEDVYYMPEEYTQEMLYGLETNIKPDRTDLDLLFACLTEWGLLLSKPYSSEKIGGYTVHYYDGKELAACFNENISEAVIRKIAGQHPRRAVFCDASFSDSAAKINMSELFRTISPETQIKVI